MAARAAGRLFLASLRFSRTVHNPAFDDADAMRLTLNPPASCCPIVMLASPRGIQAGV
jgi:hypothetical protein